MYHVLFLNLRKIFFYGHPTSLRVSSFLAIQVVEFERRGPPPALRSLFPLPTDGWRQQSPSVVAVVGRWSCGRYYNTHSTTDGSSSPYGVSQLSAKSVPSSKKGLSLPTLLNTLRYYGRAHQSNPTVAALCARLVRSGGGAPFFPFFM